MHFTIQGKVTPYTRMTQRSKHVSPRAKEYLVSKMGVGLQLKQQMAANGWDMLPSQTPLAVAIAITSPDGHISDLDNLAKAIIDSAQGIVFKDDRWIDTIVARREKGEEYEVQLTVKVM